MIYGVLRNDLVIIIGQLLVYYIYARNLHFKNSWTTIPILIRSTILITPFIIIGFILKTSTSGWFSLIYNKEIPLYMQILGFSGQIIFNLRFIIQWIDSEELKDSVFSNRFWIFSQLGSGLIITYAVLRLDPALFVGQLSGFVMYLRNLLIRKKMERMSKS